MFSAFQTHYSEWATVIQEEDDRTRLSMLKYLKYFKIKFDKPQPEENIVVTEDLINYYLQAKSGFREIVKKLIAEIKVLKRRYPQADIEFIINTINKKNIKNPTLVGRRYSSFGEYEKEIALYEKSKTTSNVTGILKSNLANSKCFLLPDSNLNYYSVILHIAFVIYTSIQLPLWVALRFKPEPHWILLEALTFFETLLFLAIKLRTAIYYHGYLTIKLKHTMSKALEDGLWIDLIALIPFNLFFGIFEINTIAAAPFRIMRILQAFNLRRDFTYLQGRYRNAHTLINLIKSILVLWFVWHWTSCLWYFISWNFALTSTERNWYDEVGLESKSYFMQWMNSLLFTMSLASTAGYAEQRVYADFERVVLVFVVLIGSMMFALGFGLMSSSTRMFSEFFEKNYILLRKMQRMRDKNSISRSTLEKIYSFTGVKMSSQFEGMHDLDILENTLPKILMEELAFGKVKNYFNKLACARKLYPFFKSLSSAIKIKAYLPMDFLYRKGEKGDKLYFVFEGAIGFVDKDEREIKKLAVEGDIIDECSLFHIKKKQYSAIVLQNSIIGALDHATFEKIVSQHPKSNPALKDEILEFYDTTNIRKIKIEDSPTITGTPFFKPYKQKLNYNNGENHSHRIADPTEGDEFILPMEKLDLQGLKKEKGDGVKESIEGQEFENMGPENNLRNFFKQKIPTLAEENLEEKQNDLYYMETPPKPKIKTDISDRDSHPIYQLNEIKECSNFRLSDAFSEDLQPEIERHELVEENEFLLKDEKPSLRIKPLRKGERRYSRTSLEQVLKLTKSSGVNLRWGMNLE